MGVRYIIGSFARNLGVSAGFLKHHESYGLLKPTCTESGYRYYELAQGTQVVQCLKLQALGFSSRESAEMLLNLNQEQLLERLAEKQLELRRKRTLLRLSDDYITEMLHAFAAPGAAEWTIEMSAPFYYSENVCGNDFEETPAQQQVARRWNEYMPLVEICSRYRVRPGSPPEPEMLGAKYMGLRIDKAAGDALDVFLNESVVLVESRRCLVYHAGGLREKEEQRTRQSILQEALALCRQHGFRLSDDVFCFQRFCSTVNDANEVLETALLFIE